MTDPKLLVVGSLAFDSVETPFGRVNDILGGSASFLSTAASYFCGVRMVGVVGEDFPEEHLATFRARRIDTSGVERRAGSTFRWRGRYDTNLNVAHTLETQLNVLASFDPRLPAAWNDSSFVVLGNLSPEVQARVLDQLKSPKLVAADTMNYWIERARPALEKTLERVQLLSVNDAEARQLSGEYNLVKAAQIIRRMGPEVVVVKRGEHGATVFTEHDIFMAPAYPLQSIKDPTGAGDSFAGAMVGYLAARGSLEPVVLRQAAVIGSVLASFAVEDFSLQRFQSLSRDEIRVRFTEFKRLTHFDTDGASLFTS